MKFSGFNSHTTRFIYPQPSNYPAINSEVGPNASLATAMQARHIIPVTYPLCMHLIRLVDAITLCRSSFIFRLGARNVLPQDSKFSCCSLRSNVPRWGCPKLLGAPKQITQPTPPSFAEETVSRLALIDKKLSNALNSKQVSCRCVRVLQFLFSCNHAERNAGSRWKGTGVCVHLRVAQCVPSMRR